ncbi:MAG: ABC transporter permease [Syntrophomonadaceae bacterium]|nr:ABC transporter permease [Syntrophomonadaceae bacterium]
MVKNPDRIITALFEHLELSLLATLMGLMVAIPLGIYLTRNKKLAGPVFSVVNFLQTIPGLALLGFMIPIFGLGNETALAALFIYAILPILRNTYTGIDGVDPFLIEAGGGMGMTRRQLLFLVEIPNALPVIMAGIRVSAVIIIGWATLAAYVGGGGLGRLIMGGLAMSRPEMVLAGAIPAAILALLTDFCLGRLEMKLIPRGLRQPKQ